MIRSLLTVAILLAALALSTPATAQVTLQNDSLEDEGDGAVMCGFVVGEKFASVFVPEPGHYPFVIEEVQFMLSPYRQEGGECVLVDERAGISLTVEIYNDDAPSVDPPRPALYSSSDWSVGTSATALNSLDIRSAQEVRIESGVVRVAITVPADDTSPLRDIDGITSERNLIYLDSGSWTWAEDVGVTGDWLVRLVITPEPGPEPDDVEPAPDTAEDVVEDTPPDTPEDMATDLPGDPAEEEDEGSLGGGGCTCALASPASTATLLPLVLALLALALGRPGRR
jgi:hypothetical protein